MRKLRLGLRDFRRPAGFARAVACETMTGSIIASTIVNLRCLTLELLDLCDQFDQLLGDDQCGLDRMFLPEANIAEASL